MSDVLATFTTLGGAAVELHPMTFTTRFDYRGAPWAASTPYEVDGYNWRCRGCAAYGREGDSYNDPGFRCLDEARTEANAHAGECRSALVARWEYKTDLYSLTWSNTLDDVLKARGKDGWELVAVDFNSRQVVFKRHAGGAS